MWESGQMAHKLVVVAWLLTGLILLVGCGEDSSSEMSAVTPTPLSGETMQELVIYTPAGGKLIYSSFEILMKTDGLPYEVKIMEGVTTDLTVQGLKDGVFDMIFMRSLPGPNEGIEFFEILRADVAIHTHPTVAVDNLTTEEIAAIFSGEITNWSEVGGADQAIVLFVLPESDSTTEAFRSAVLGEKPFGGTARTFADGPSVIVAVTRIPGGIGYATWAGKNVLKIIDQSMAEADFHAVSVDGMTLDHPDYPMSIIIGFGYLAEQTEFLKPFFDWVTDYLNSSQGQLLLQMLEVEPATDG